MENNEQTQETTMEDMSPEQVLVKMRETMVPKEEAEQWKQKYNSLFREVATNTFKPDEEKKEPTEQEKKTIFNDAINRINSHKDRGAKSVMEDMLKVEDYLIAKGQRSMFAPSSGVLDQQTIESCNRTREAMRYIVENSDTDEEAQAKLTSQVLLFNK